MGSPVTPGSCLLLEGSSDFQPGRGGGGDVLLPRGAQRQRGAAAGAALAAGTCQGVRAPRSICGSSACLCFRHSLHKMKAFPEFCGSV